MGGGSGKHQHLQGPSQWSVSTGQRRVVPRPHVQLTVVLQQQRPGSSVQGPGSFRLDHLCDRRRWVGPGLSPPGCLATATADAMTGCMLHTCVHRGLLRTGCRPKLMPLRLCEWPATARVRNPGWSFAAWGAVCQSVVPPLVGSHQPQPWRLSVKLPVASGPYGCRERGWLA